MKLWHAKVKKKCPEKAAGNKGFVQTNCSK